MRLHDTRRDTEKAYIPFTESHTGAMEKPKLEADTIKKQLDFSAFGSSPTNNRSTTTSDTLPQLAAGARNTTSAAIAGSQQARALQYLILEL